MNLFFETCFKLIQSNDIAKGEIQLTRLGSVNLLSSYTDEFKDKYLLKEYDFQVPVRHFEWYELYIDFTKKLIHRPSH